MKGTSSKRGKHVKYLPYAFTEQGVAMLSSVLNSDESTRRAREKDWVPYVTEFQ
jgi:hypothetical protein